MATTETGTPAEPAAPSTELARDLRLFDVTMVGVGAMIGAGIFALTGIAAGAAGPGLILAFALNGILTLCNAMVYAEIGSAIPGAGGGYLWTKFGLPGPSAFLTGWMDWLAHAVAGSLYAVVFGSYVVWGMQTVLGWGDAPTGAGQGMGTLFGFSAIYAAKLLTLAICLVFIYINYCGSSETGKAGSTITVTKIIVIGIFIAFGLAAIARGGATGADLTTVPVGEKFSPFLPNGMSGVLIAMGLTFIAFEGYEIIVQAGEEVVRPRTNIPKAVFWSLAIVIPIYILVAIVCLGSLSIPTVLIAPDGPFDAAGTWAFLAALGETGVAEAANQFMPWGTGAVLLVVGAVLSTMSALNATTYSSTRVCFAMGRDHNLPNIVAVISPKTRTPIVALFVSGTLITVTALTLDAEKVAAATCVMFLLVFTAVNISAITIRRKYGDKLNYGYIMPLFPFFPIVAIIGQLGVAVFLFIHEPMSMYITAGWVSLGLVIYYTYSRHQEHALKATPIVFEQKPLVDTAKTRILVPIANPANAGPLTDLASRLALADNGSIVILHVIALPEQLPYEAADHYVGAAREVVDAATRTVTNVPRVGLVRISHHPSQSIEDTIIDRDCDSLIMGWSGPKRVRGQYSLGLSARVPLIGSQIDRVMTHVDADTVVMRGRLPDKLDRILIPLVNPRQGRFAIEVAESVANEGACLNLLMVAADQDQTDQKARDVMEQIFESPEFKSVTKNRKLQVTMNARVDSSPLRAILHAAEENDLVVVGAASETWLSRRSFTRFHLDLARGYKGPLLLVKLRSGRARFTLQRWFTFFASKEPQQ